MGYMKKLREMLCGKRSHEGSGFKAGSRPAIILQTLCEGVDLSGWDVCKLLKTHNGDRELRRVRKMLRARGIPFSTYHLKAENGRLYKVTSVSRLDAVALQGLIVGKGA